MHSIFYAGGNVISSAAKTSFCRHKKIFDFFKFGTNYYLREISRIYPDYSLRM